MSANNPLEITKNCILCDKEIFHELDNGAYVVCWFCSEEVKYSEIHGTDLGSDRLEMDE